jgi:hypothetical protein
MGVSTDGELARRGVLPGVQAERRSVKMMMCQYD